jgi:hypothetical protein
LFIPEFHHTDGGQSQVRYNKAKSGAKIYEISGSHGGEYEDESLLGYSIM